ncbi:hypothetical protein NC651_001574 [Populus alba x Populus x berolinensis]|nr:hypothetical protein NC651_001574 [Populus alba x Populus x berolinensis]
MAASSPVISNNSSDIGQTTISAAAAASFSVPPKTLRGLNKPKCIQCGNVARSRCPYQSCKSCCSRAQNPCHIHVLKANATFPDKTPASSAPLFEQQPNEAPPAVSSHRTASLRQLSSNFSQFNNLHSPLRSRKSLTRKEAAAINEWRFSKLKEFKDRNIEVENEAFDRYMHNISLLEEVFSLKSFLEGSTEDGSLSSNHDHASAEDDTEEKMVSEQKLKLRSNPRSENVRKRLQQLVDGGLKKLQKLELNNGSVNNQNELDKRPEKAKGLRAERASALSDLIDKLNKARSEEDLNSCMEIKAQLSSQHTRSRTETKDVEVSKEQIAKNDVAPPQKEMDYFSQKLFRTVEIDHQALTSIDAHFSSLEKIEDL